MSKQREIDEYAKTAVLPPGALPDAADDGGDLDADVAADAHGSYEEYVQSLDDVPVLRDVLHEPPKHGVRDFRVGERPDVRKRARPDGYVLREQNRAELERRYAEYVEFTDDSARPAKPPKRVASKKKRTAAGRTARAGRRKG